MSVKLEILNAKEVKQVIAQFDKTTLNDVSTGVGKASIFMQSEVKNSIAGRRDELTSVDTGRFLNSVTETHNALEGIVYSDLEYAKFLEYGTSKLFPRRHFFNSLTRNKSNITSILKEAVSH